MGSVYILTNESMPGLVKIGFTETQTAQARADQLYHGFNDTVGTGVPTPFDVVYEEFCDNPRELETLIHQELAEVRPNKDREFFTFSDPSEAIQKLKEVHKRQPSHANCVSSDSLWRKWTSQFITRFSKLSNRRTPVPKEEEQI